MIMKTILLLIAALVLLSHPCFATTYSYDTLNRLTHVGYDNGNSVDYSYDTGGNITQVAKVVNGICGDSSGATFTTPPTSNLCSSGTASGSGLWSWDCTGTSNTVNCSATIQTYAVSFNSGGNGTLTGTASQTVNHGSNAETVTAVPNTGYHFVNWTEDATVVGTTTELTISNVTATHSYTANFNANPVDGLCGGSNGGVFRIAPAANLCAVGSATTVTGSGPWSWRCNSSNSGNNVDCSAGIDITDPMLTLSTLDDGAITNNATLNISGTVADANGVAGLTINNTAVTITNGSFSHVLTLQSGANTITFIATDIPGNSTTNSRTITLDVAAPTLTISVPADNSKTAQSTATISGTINETSTVTVKVNSGSPQNAAITGTAYEATVNLASGLNNIVITATDLANNTSSAVRSVTYDNTNPSLAITTPNQDITTAQSSITLSGTVSDANTTTTVSVGFNNQALSPTVTAGAFSQLLTFPSEGTWPIVVTATDEVGNVVTATRNIIYAIPINGVCGSSHGLAQSATPDTNLCSAGTATTVSDFSPWSWTCIGSKGGTDAVCSAESARSATSDGATQPTIADALKAFQAVNGITTLTPEELIRYDVAPLSLFGTPLGNGAVDYADVILILRRSIGIGSW